eukprot:m.109180 g.109180  ORF g.109180 m.109180 type:complete len:1486 (+) comp10688_c0_seq1:93-4550(+)
MAMQRILAEKGVARGAPTAADTMAEMDALAGNLASAIKELQREVATASEDSKTIRRGRNVLGFCNAIELVLRHGLASTWRNGFSATPSFWAVASRISRKDIISDLKSLSNAANDHARARAWIRLAINECALESYVSVLSQDQDTLTSYYESWAMLRDAENMSKVMMLLAGMSFTMEFDLTVDDPSLQFEPTPVAVSIGDARNSTSTPTMGRRSEPIATTRQRTNSTPPAVAGSVGGATEAVVGTPPAEVSGSYTAAATAVHLEESPLQTERKTRKKKKKKRSAASVPPPPQDLDDMLAGISAQPPGPGHEQPRASLSATPSSSVNVTTPSPDHTPLTSPPNIGTIAGPDAHHNSSAGGSGSGPVHVKAAPTPVRPPWTSSDGGSPAVDGTPAALLPSDGGMAAGTGGPHRAERSSSVSYPTLATPATTASADTSGGLVAAGVEVASTAWGAVVKKTDDGGQEVREMVVDMVALGDVDDGGASHAATDGREQDDRMPSAALQPHHDGNEGGMDQVSTRATVHAARDGDGGGMSNSSSNAIDTTTTTTAADNNDDDSALRSPQMATIPPHKRLGEDFLEDALGYPDPDPTPPRKGPTSTASTTAVPWSGVHDHAKVDDRNRDDDHGHTAVGTTTTTTDLTDSVATAPAREVDTAPGTSNVPPPTNMTAEEEDKEEAVPPPRVHPYATSAPINVLAGARHRQHQKTLDGDVNTMIRAPPASPAGSNFEELLAKRTALGLASSMLSDSGSGAGSPRSSILGSDAGAGGGDAVGVTGGGGGSGSAYGHGHDDEGADVLGDGRTGPESRYSYSETQASILEMLQNQMKEYSDLVEAEEDVVREVAVGPSHHLSKASWDVGSMSEEECVRIVSASQLGSFLVRMDLDDVPDNVDPSKENWALYVSEKGNAVKFPIKASPTTDADNDGDDSSCFVFMDTRYPTLDAIVAAVEDGHPVLETDNGRRLRLTSAAHDATAWLATTAFSEGQDDMPCESTAATTGHDSHATDTAGSFDMTLRAKVSDMDGSGPDTAPATTNLLSHTDTSTSEAASGSAPPPPVDASSAQRGASSGDDFVMVEDHFDAGARAVMPTESVDDLLRRQDRLVTSLSPGPRPPSTQLSEREQAAYDELEAVREQLRVSKDAIVEAIERESGDHVAVSFAGHKFIEFGGSEQRPCDVCLKPVTKKFLSNASVPQAYSCGACSVVVHRKCQAMVSRRCIAVEDPDLDVETRICPDNQGLAAQEYKCDDCKADIGFQGAGSVFAEARVCDYLGRYMCPDCHRMDEEATPARILLNWDFRPRPVSRRAKESLSVLRRRPVIDLNSVNPLLVGHVEEVLEFTRLRQALIKMNTFLKLCRVASAQPNLANSLAKRRYLCDSERLISIQDLLDIKNGSLNDELKVATANCEKHITKECMLCQARGSYCELCRSDQLIFPFSPSTTQCKECKSLFHTACWSKAVECPRCVRLRLYALKRERRKDPNFSEAVDDDATTDA